MYCVTCTITKTGTIGLFALKLGEMAGVKRWHGWDARHWRE